MNTNNTVQALRNLTTQAEAIDFINGLQVSTLPSESRFSLLNDPGHATVSLRQILTKCTDLPNAIERDNANLIQAISNLESHSDHAITHRAWTLCVFGLLYLIIVKICKCYENYGYNIEAVKIALRGHRIINPPPAPAQISPPPAPLPQIPDQERMRAEQEAKDIEKAKSNPKEWANDLRSGLLNKPNYQLDIATKAGILPEIFAYNILLGHSYGLQDKIQPYLLETLQKIQEMIKQDKDFSPLAKDKKDRAHVFKESVIDLFLLLYETSKSESDDKLADEVCNTINALINYGIGKKIRYSDSTPTAYAALILREGLAQISNIFYPQEKGWATQDDFTIKNFHTRAMQLYTRFEKQIIEQLENHHKDLHESFLREILNNCQFHNLFVGIYIIEHSFWDHQLFRTSDVQLVTLFHGIEDRLWGEYILRIKSPAIIEEIIKALAPGFPDLKYANQNRLVPIFQSMDDKQREKFFPGIFLREKAGSTSLNRQYELFQTKPKVIEK